jgi:hypothetical protein
MGTSTADRTRLRPLPDCRGHRPDLRLLLRPVADGLRAASAALVRTDLSVLRRPVADGLRAASADLVRTDLVRMVH